MLLFVLLGILLHNSVPHIHHEHSELISEEASEEASIHHHGHSHKSHQHRNNGLDFEFLWQLLIDIHAHGDQESDFYLTHYELIKNNEHPSKIQLVALTNSLTCFPSPVYFENQLIPLNCQLLPPPYFDCIDLRGPPSLG